MKYLALLLFCLFSLTAECSDTLYVENNKDVRYQRYLDSLQAYEIGYSVAKNIADSVRRMIGNNSLDPYFLSRFTSVADTSSGDYFYAFQENEQIEIGHVNDAFHGMKNDSKFPWKYLETQYNRLNAIKIQPVGIMHGGELPNVYVYAKPAVIVLVVKIKRYTVVDESIKFISNDNGKTKISYIRKFYYSRIGFGHEKIDSIEKLDPMSHQHLSIPSLESPLPDSAQIKPTN